MLQETKLYRKGQIKIANFQVFEKLCAQNCGGGLLTAAHEQLQPCLIESDNDNPNLFVVECKIGNSTVHLINGNEPQEDDQMCEKLDF